VKVILKYAFSQARVIVLSIVYAVLGAEIYMSMEIGGAARGPAETAQDERCSGNDDCVSVFV
jgi:hypothetical protein